MVGFKIDLKSVLSVVSEIEKNRFLWPKIGKKMAENIQKNKKSLRINRNHGVPIKQTHAIKLNSLDKRKIHMIN